MPYSFHSPLMHTGRTLTLVALVMLAAFSSLISPVRAHTETNLQLLDQALSRADEKGDVAIDDVIFPRASFVSYRDRVAAQGDRQLSSAFYQTPRWTRGNVYYLLDGKLPPAQRTAFIQATKEWEKWARLKFIVRTTQSNYIHVYQDQSDASFSYLGMVGGPQDLSLGSWAMKWNACHEIAHALGVLHEQSRSDRNNYISIDFKNVDKEAASNFAIVSDSINKGTYDFDSVMHYFDKAFALDASKPTIKCKPAYAQYQSTMGQRDHLSDLDKAGMAAVYGAPVSSYSVVGTVTRGSAGLSGVSLTLNNGQTTNTNSEGEFKLPSVATGTYTLTPSKTGYLFSPTSRKITVSGNLTELNFSATAAPATLSISSVTMAEGNAGTPYMTFNVILSEPSRQTVTVNFATFDGSAVAGKDYTAKTGTLTLKAGETMAEVRINLGPDRVNEANETFGVALYYATGATIKTNVGKGIIMNDDNGNADAPGDAFDPSAPDG